MKQYISFFKLKFAIGLQYKAAALAGLATQFFFGFVFIMVYIAFYGSDTTSADITLKQLIQYIWLGQAFFALTYVWHHDNEVLSMITKGDVAYELCRPQNLYIMWFVRILASKLSSVVLRCIPVLIIAFILPEPYNLILPYSFTSFIFFLITLVISSLLISALVTIMYVLIFYSIDSKGIKSIYCGLAEILAGQVIPIPLFPNFLKVIATYLPFAYISDFSFRIYSGNITGNAIIEGVVIQVVWLIILVIIGMLSTNKILKKVSVQGG